MRADLGGEMPSLLGSLAHPDVLQFSVEVAGERVYGLVHPDSESWARITPRSHDTARLDHGARGTYGQSDHRYSEDGSRQASRGPRLTPSLSARMGATNSP
ncbi:hypothetical protein GCM10009863_67350 [Streptomyces axinellae]|uniref:Uncharacterized protein n=1 Tax=Streptomyces axinellae TaxID=552788 RepID=A0ABN3R1J7_9ACTN